MAGGNHATQPSSRHIHEWGVRAVSSQNVTSAAPIARRDAINSCANLSRRSLATAAAPNATADASSSSTSSSNDDKSKSNDGKKKKDDSNVFLDNLGKIFLSTIGLVLATLLRSTKANNSRTALREDIESTALLDPLEIDDLRAANTDFTVEVWEKIAEDVRREFAQRDGGVTYPEFLSLVMGRMKEEKGEGFTVQLGHLLDRVVIAELERISEKKDGTSGDWSLAQTELPVPFLLAVLSLALNGTVADRIRVLYECMPSESTNEMDDDNAQAVSGENVAEMIGYLQRTCQLVPEAQIVETNSKVPYQTYRVGTGDELTKRAREGFGGKKGSAGVTKEADGPVSLEDFHAILRSRTVCAWGECYVKKTGRTSTSDR